MLEGGISLYLSTGYEKNKAIIKKASAANLKYAFTSLHIPEEKVDYQLEVTKLLKITKEYNISLIIDISPQTLIKLGIKSFDELKKTSISHLRLDYGFSTEEMIALSRDFTIVFNASTMIEDEIKSLINKGVNLKNIMACHNFYPKPYTGLSIEDLKNQNLLFKKYHIKTISFVAGNTTLRGPLYQGLPTIELHRSDNIIENILDSYFNGLSDIVLIGDIDVEDNVYECFSQLQQNYLTLRANINTDYDFITEIIHHDRIDSSAYLFRSVESRLNKSYLIKHKPSNMIDREVGSIAISNENYGRYNGELEITKIFIKEDDKVNVIGQVIKDDLKYLNYLNKGFGIKLIKQ